jgi:hypothetical protein
MKITDIQSTAQSIFDSKKDLVEFYFNSPKNIKQNQILRPKRNELALLMSEQILEQCEDFQSSNLILIAFHKNKVETKEFKSNLSNLEFQRLVKAPEFYMVLGNFDLINNEFKSGPEKRFFMEIVSSGSMEGTLSPFMIEADSIRYGNKKSA